MWIKKSCGVYITLVAMLIALIFRICYISFGGLNEKVRPVAGGRHSTITLYNAKGIIYDKNLLPIAGDQFSYCLLVNPREFDKSMTNYISLITNTDVEFLNKKLLNESVFVLNSYQKPDEIKGVYVFEGTTRYPKTPIAKHIIGYLDDEEIVGVSGVERAFNKFLLNYSSSSSITYSVNALRGAISAFGMKQNIFGENSKNGVVLTLDKKLSLKAEAIFKEQIDDGALVIMNAQNGDILSICSQPDYDINKISEYVNSDSNELINNAINNQPVGSVFKIIVAASAILNGLEKFEYNCSGGISVNDRVFTCQNNKSHKHQTLNEAFANSCNAYFIALGQLLGYEKLIDTAQIFGIDSSIELCKDIKSTSGVLPQNSNSTALANLSIGQGDLMITPLQIARMTAVICNGGYLVNPNIYKSLYIDNQTVNPSNYNYRIQIVNSAVSEKLKKMCIACVENGTGSNAKPTSSAAGGKTASAQTGRYNKNGTEILDTYFTGFFPADNPQYVITVFAKDGKSGSATCAPVFKEICDFIDENY